MHTQAIDIFGKNVNQISNLIHPNDDLFINSTNGWIDYVSMGRSTVELLDSIKAKYQLRQVQILDFGCGHKRIAHDLRTGFPDASITFLMWIEIVGGSAN